MMNNTVDKPEGLRQLHNIRGYQIRIECSQSVKARRLPTFEQNEQSLVSIKLEYLGAADNMTDISTVKKTILYPVNDKYTYKWIGSPFPEKPRQYLTYGLIQDNNGQIWCSYYNEIYIKDDAIFDKRLQIKFEIPEILVRKSPELTIYCNGEVVFNNVFCQSGSYCYLLDVSNTGKEFHGYISEIRSQQKSMIKGFSDICTRHGLRWYLICGGLIGVIRDGDLIPWDDDLDIAMPKEDYIRFMEISQDEFIDYGLLRVNYDEYGEDVFLDFMTRLLFMNKSIQTDPFARNQDKGRREIRNHLPMDIYILEPVCKSPLRQRVIVLKKLIYYGLALGHRGSYDPDKRRKNKSVIWNAGEILRKTGKKINLKKIYKWYSNSERRNSKESDSYYLSNGYYQCYYKQFKKEWFDGDRTVTLLEQKIPIPKEAEKVLSVLYGDYLSYPPVWDRVPGYIETEWNQ